MSGPYDDIINLPHHVSRTRPQMPRADRAAQFAPFSALVGYGAALVETARLTDRRIELEEDDRAAMDRKQQKLMERIGERPEVAVTWFVPDARKEGGQYITTVGRLKRIDEVRRVMVLVDRTEIPLDDVLDIEAEE
ncbi:hypothetical protein [Pseudoflavonifractor phocaeensis]|uniref:hypothetical protein n=1 Tax=Pseudoflavonifractor phocaeensis TaxID=1870988 RepID=UPI00195D8599|nr:hypothetical protein [Pseudoflavonifractor phocaeensis]MBM6722521.1 hypothetical protein [Pseudoflavonifractor phocaeensis]